MGLLKQGCKNSGFRLNDRQMKFQGYPLSNSSHLNVCCMMMNGKAAKFCCAVAYLEFIAHDSLANSPTLLTTLYSKSSNCLKCASPQRIFCFSLGCSLFKSTAAVPVSLVSATK